MQSRKLTLNKETLTTLAVDQAQQADGGTVTLVYYTVYRLTKGIYDEGVGSLGPCSDGNVCAGARNASITNCYVPYYPE